MTLLIGLLACTPAPALLGDPVVELSVSPNVPMVPIVTWSAAGPASVRVEGPDGSWDTEPGDAAAGVPVFGLAPDTSYTLTALSPEGDALDSVVFDAPPVPDALSRSQAVPTHPEASTLGDGGVVMAIAAVSTSFVAIMDAGGNWVWWMASEPGLTVASPRPTLDGTGLWFAQHERERVEDRSIATRVSWDGRERTDWRTPEGHHMLAELPDGRLAYLSHTSQLVEDGVQNREILTDTIEVTDGTDVERRFDFFDVAEPTLPCFHAAQPKDKFDYLNVYEWTHGNSLVHDADAGLFYVMSWHLDALFAIDAATGERVWQLGGVDATRAFAGGPPDAFAHAHTSWVDAEQAWVFDNRVHQGTTSRLIRYDLTVDPVVPTVEIYEAGGRTIGFLGDVQAAPGGHVLGAWTVPGDVVEYDEDGRELWRGKLGPGSVLGRIHYVELPR